MPEQESSPWTQPVEIVPPKSLEDAYANGLRDDADIDDMKMIARGKPTAEFSDAPASKDISVTKEQYQQLGTADPESAEVSAFMKEHALDFGGDLKLDVEGIGPTTVTVDKEDFFTKVREGNEALTPSEILHEKASEDLAEESFDVLEVKQLENGEPVETDVLGAEAARKLMEIEDTPVEVPAPMPESTPKSIADIMGGGIVAPAVAEVTPTFVAPVEVSVETSAEAAVEKSEANTRREIGFIESSAAEIDHSISKLDLLVDDIEDLTTLAGAIDAGESGPDAAHAVLNRVEDRLESLYRRINPAAKYDMIDVSTHLESLLRTVGGEAATLFDVESVDATRRVLDGKMGDLEDIITQVGALKHNVGYLDAVELRLVADKLSLLSQDTVQLRLTPKLEAAILELRR